MNAAKKGPLGALLGQWDSHNKYIELPSGVI